MAGLFKCYGNTFTQPSSATTNSLCDIRKKNLVFTTTIRIRNRTIVVPCGLLKHLIELEQLIEFMPIDKAILFLIQKFSIELPTKPQNTIKRYKYTTTDAKVLFPIIQFKTSFRLGKYVDFVVPLPRIPEGFIIEKSYVLEACNDDTRTFSNTYSDMEQYATYWLSTLTLPSYCILCVTIKPNGKPLQPIAGKLTLVGNQIIFTAIIQSKYYIYFNQYPENTNVTIFNKNVIMENNYQFLQDFYPESIEQKKCNLTKNQ